MWINTASDLLTFENDFAYPDQYSDLLDVTIDQHLSHQYSKTDHKKKYLAVAGTVGWPGRLLPQNTIFLMHQPITHSSGYSAVVCTESLGVAGWVKGKSTLMTFSSSHPTQGITSMFAPHAHCKYIQCNFYTFYLCPIFHCNPTVLFTFNCCSKYFGINAMCVLAVHF